MWKTSMGRGARHCLSLKKRIWILALKTLTSCNTLAKHSSLWPTVCFQYHGHSAHLAGMLWCTEPTSWSSSLHPLVPNTEAKMNPVWPLFSPGAWLPAFHWHLMPYGSCWHGSHFPLAHWVFPDTPAFLLLLSQAVVPPASGPAHILRPLPSRCPPTMMLPFPWSILMHISDPW